jgi:ATP-dependent RNA helicase RhlE
LSKFKEGKLQVLVATDVAARGLDIDDMPLVVNYELPHVPEDYIHRIGRTGRAGASGEAISFVAPEEEKYLAEIERLLKKKVPIETAEGFDADAASRGRERAPRATSSRSAHGEQAQRPARSRASSPEPRTRGASGGTRREDAGHGDARRRDAQHEAGSYGDARRAEREAAYARNPDQPITKQAHTSAHDTAAAHHPHAHIHSAHRRVKPVPALLQKRKVRETEDA